MNTPPDPLETSTRIAKTFSGVTDEPTRKAAIKDSLVAALASAVYLPLIFALQNYALFRDFSPTDLGYGVTLFFVLYHLLWALGLFFLPRTEYHTTVKLKGGFLDRLAAFWLVACAFGPFFGWIATTGAIPITTYNWRYLYAAKVVLTIALPLLTALPMLRYVRGKAALIQLPLLFGITILPIMCGLHAAQDLRSGPIPRLNRVTDKVTPYLAHTETWLPT